MLMGFVLLVVGGDFLVRASVALSLRLNISKMVIGLTVVSFATSLPELLVSLNAALNGSPSIAINNVVGSNIANIGLVLGITALIGTIYVDKTFYKFNWPVLMLFSMLFYYFLSNDNQLISISAIVVPKITGPLKDHCNIESKHHNFSKLDLLIPFQILES